VILLLLFILFVVVVVLTQREVFFRPIWLHFCVVDDAQNKHIKKTKKKKNRSSVFVVMSKAISTRAQKRRMEERDVWSLVVNKNDDVFVSNTFSPEIEFERM
jgi:hypothetical protein